jgi:hypothetical protein
MNARALIEREGDSKLAEVFILRPGPWWSTGLLSVVGMGKVLLFAGDYQRLLDYADCSTQPPQWRFILFGCGSASQCSLRKKRSERTLTQRTPSLRCEKGQI